MLPLIKFNYNNTTYCVESDDKKLKYYSLKKDKKNYHLSKEEREIIDYVVNEVTPSKNIIKLMDFTFNNRQYKMYLDKKTGLRLFKPTPNNKDLIALNKIFNNMSETLAYNIGEHLPVPDNTPYYKRIIKIGGKIVVAWVLGISMTVTILTSSIMPPQVSYTAKERFFGIEYNEQEIAYTNTITDEEYLLRITNAINNNNNLNEKEKEAMLSNPKVFLDNKDKTNIRYIERTQSDLKIVYCKESKGNTQGEYNPTTNCIYFYNATCFEEVNKNDFFHEFSHTLTQYTNDCNHFLIETTNTIFTSEYYTYDKNDYRKFINYTYALMEIIGSEPLKQYHNYTKLEYITDPLYQIIPDHDKAEKLLALLENYKEIYEGTTHKTIDIDEGNQELNKLDETIKEELKEYYQKKYGHGIETDLFMLYYLDCDTFNQEIIKSAKEAGLGISFENHNYEVTPYLLAESTYFNDYSTCPKCIFVTTKAYPTSNKTDCEYGNKIIISKDRYIGDNSSKKDAICSECPYLFHALDEELKKELIKYNLTLRKSINLARALIEIVGPNAVKEYYNTGNTDAIIESLCKLTEDKEIALNLLKNLNEYCSMEASFYESNDQKNLNKMEEFAEETGMYDELSNYYYKKTGKKIQNDLIMLSYLKPDEFKNLLKETMLTSKQKELYCECVVNDYKRYFIEPLGAANVIVLDSNDNYTTIMIDDSNRYQTNNTIEQTRHHR